MEYETCSVKTTKLLEEIKEDLNKWKPQIQRCNLCYREDQHYWRRRKSHCEHAKTGVSLRARQLLFFSALLIQGI